MTKTKTTEKTERGVCPRCNGKGRIDAFGHYLGGDCFLCGTTGEIAIRPVQPDSEIKRPSKTVDLGLDTGDVVIVKYESGEFGAHTTHDGSLYFRIVAGRIMPSHSFMLLIPRAEFVDALQSALRVKAGA